MHHRKTDMYINFQLNQVKITHVMTVHTSLFAKIASCVNLQLPIIFFNSTLLEMHHRRTYMHINFHQNRVVDRLKPCT